jgi:hypothetical protein
MMYYFFDWLRSREGVRKRAIERIGRPCMVFFMYGVFLKGLLKIKKNANSPSEFAIFYFSDPFERAPRWAKSNK